MIPVTKPILPDLAKYGRYLEQIHERAWLTNFGPLHNELTERLKELLGVEYLLLVANGTLALQVAYRALDVSGAVLTTPFSFVATTSSMAWERIDPLFVDIDRATFNLDPSKLVVAPEASAIVPVHVFGNPCDVHAIASFAESRSIPVIYDAAHAFGSELNNESILHFGDAATLSFHATKIFHTVEGGAIVFRSEESFLRARSLINFGLAGDRINEVVGINGKMSEYHAAAGLTLLDRIAEILQHRAELVGLYKQLLGGCVEFQQWANGGRETGAYMPVLLRDDAQVRRVQSRLGERGIQTRRYFWPSLNQLPWPVRTECPVSEEVAARILCLPLYADLRSDDVKHIGQLVRAAII